MLRKVLLAATTMGYSKEVATAVDHESLDEAPAPMEVYYFGYGPMVNEMVRQRRGITATEVQAAFLPDYRLTFHFGGNANIVKKIGFEVHGLLMKLKREDWEKVCHCDEGLSSTIRSVIPYKRKSSWSVGNDDDDSDDRGCEEDSHNADDDFREASTIGAVQAHLIELPKYVEDAVWQTPISILPQERYLNLIAEGMRKECVDEDYIKDQIESCPFIPRCKPEDFATFPSAKKVTTINFKKYLKLCSKSKTLYFVIGRKVFRCGEHNVVNPAAQFIKLHCHGKPDCCYLLHLTMVDPYIPLVNSPKNLTPLHFAWAENHAFESLAKHQLQATQVHEIFDSIDEEDPTEQSSQELADVRDYTKRRSCWHWIFCPWWRWMH